MRRTATVTRFAVAFLLVFCGLATAQQSVYFVERGHWWVGIARPDQCRAGNRPVEEMSASPFNSLQFVVGPGHTIGVDLYLWPGAVEPAEPQDLILRFDANEQIRLPAKATTDFQLRAEPVARSPILRRLADARRLRVTLVGRNDINILFTFEDSTWLLQSLLTCAGFLPKQ